jgi:tRNA pseudouridine38-40 synthase
VPRYKLTIAYDGTDFVGWQKQEPPERDADAAPGVTPAYSERIALIEGERPGRVALRTVQGVVENAVRAIVREPVEVLGASRTDSGVHARGQVAAFTCSDDEPSPSQREEQGEGSPSLTTPPRPSDERGLVSSAEMGIPKSKRGFDELQRAASRLHADVNQPTPTPPSGRGLGWPLSRGCERLVSAINSRLPDDVLVLSAEPVAQSFDPIGDCVSKGYSYTYHLGLERPLWDRRTVTHVRTPNAINLGAMNEAARVLIGEHDFAAFAATGHGRLSTVRTIHALSVTQTGEQRYRLEIAGSGFLWNMVRIVAGTLLQVGLGQRTPAQVRETLESRDRTKAGPTMAPEGLCLEWIKYG